MSHDAFGIRVQLMTAPLLEIENLFVSVEGTPIVKGLNLTIPEGEVHALMGRNGSGKTTLSRAIMGHPAYEITDGTIKLKGQLINDASPEEKARQGLFLSFQHPVALPGVTVGHFLSQAYRAIHGEISPRDFRKRLRYWMKPLHITTKGLSRYVNDGFSGGEKKRFETLQDLRSIFKLLKRK